MLHLKAKRFLLAMGAILALPLATAVIAAPNLPPPEQRAHVDRLLEGVRDRQGISSWVGDAIVQCLPALPTTDLCEWEVGGRSQGWQALSDAIDSDDRIMLICEFAADGSGREPGSCSAHPRRSNRTYFRNLSPPVKGHRRTVKNKRDENAKLAGEWIRSARSLADLSRLLGELPSECTDMPDGTRSCLWRTTARTYGHGTVAAWIDASKTKKIRFWCTLPKDGQPRADGSCSAEVGP
jgi:hypothetical protein